MGTNNKYFKCLDKGSHDVTLWFVYTVLWQTIHFDQLECTVENMHFHQYTYSKYIYFRSLKVEEWVLVGDRNFVHFFPFTNRPITCKVTQYERQEHTKTCWVRFLFLGCTHSIKFYLPLLLVYIITLASWWKTSKEHKIKKYWDGNMN